MVLYEIKFGWMIIKEWEGYMIEVDIVFVDVDF